MKMITINKETCAACQRCCRGKPGTTIHAHLHDGTKPKVDKNYNCEYLGSFNKCGAPHGKPIECAIYPIVISDGEVFVDMACPAWKEAVRQWDEQFGYNIDNYNDGRDDHKFVNLWIAHHQIRGESNERD